MNIWQDHRYLSFENYLARDRKRKKSFRWGLGLLIFFGMALAGGFSEEEIDGAMISTLILCGAGVAGGIFLLVRSSLLRGEIERAKRYERIFSGDRDGDVTMEELCRVTGKSRAAVLKELEPLFRKNYFAGCVLEAGGDPRVVIDDAWAGPEGFGTGFVSVKCEYCGGVTRIRSGKRGICSFCGAPIEGK